jgi:hypothetical protein
MEHLYGQPEIDNQTIILGIVWLLDLVKGRIGNLKGQFLLNSSPAFLKNRWDYWVKFEILILWVSMLFYPAFFKEDWDFWVRFKISDLWVSMLFVEISDLWVSMLFCEISDLWVSMLFCMLFC